MMKKQFGEWSFKNTGNHNPQNDKLEGLVKILINEK